MSSSPRTGAGSVKEALWEIGEMVLDDLEAIANGHPASQIDQLLPWAFTPMSS